MVKLVGYVKYLAIAIATALIFLVLAAIVFLRPWEQPKTTGSPAQSVMTSGVVAVGDIACAPNSKPTATTCQHAATANLAEKLAPSAVFLLGDLQYDAGELTNFKASFDPTWGKLKAISYPAPGNHEYTTAGATGYFDYFGERAGDRTKGYYSFDLGNWHILALNSNCTDIGGCDAASAQGQWIKEDLAKNNKICTLAYWHHPALSSGNYSRTSQQASGRALWQNVASRVDVVLNGHDHIYERFAPMGPDHQELPGGTQQFTVGTGGKSHHSQTTTQKTSQKIIDNKFGVLSLSLLGETYQWQFIDTDNQVLDEGQASCT